ncbi:polyprenyl synthetase family protein [Akkermansiaceae bacterium]|nr:polyprenyl synthetase family protein [Akkermansiaceae bacterium]
MDSRLKQWITDAQIILEDGLLSHLPSISEHPHSIHKAMHYSVFAGGKRLRPLLCLAAAEACGASLVEAVIPACAVEVLHTYSLVHDDLPCMDDDVLRRGVPTNHVVFGEGIAVLAGDALLTEAFTILLRQPSTAYYSTSDFYRVLALASGSRGMIGGQTLDLESEGKTLNLKQLEEIHSLKTAALLSASLQLGGMVANASKAETSALKEFGMLLGLAFQVVDDILDVTQTTENLGKTSGKDEKVQKVTYPSILGLEESKQQARLLTKQALQQLEIFGEKAEVLQLFAEYMLRREF